jgi:hypothetical protein
MSSRDLISSFGDRGIYALKGVPARWHIYRMLS